MQTETLETATEGETLEGMAAKWSMGGTTPEQSIQPRILIADDQPDVLDALRLLLKGHGFTIEMASSPEDLLAAVTHRQFDVILMDLNYARDTTSGREGLDVLSHLQQLEDAPPVVVMTGWATVGLAVETMQYGVGDFVEKPWTNTRLLEILRRQIALGQERRRARQQAAEEKRAQEQVIHHFQEQEQEFAEAKAIQEKLLPGEIPQVPGYDIAGAWQSARIVGGDYFDVLPQGDETLGMCIADVAGKGMPAALLMSNLQAAVRGLASPSLPPHLLCSRLNALVHRNIASDRFITFFYAQLDGAAGRLTYANAGHNAPFVVRRDGSHQRLREGGGVLGVFASQTYVPGVAQLAPGDRVILFTDGVTEACDLQDEEFGEARLLRLLEEHRGLSAHALQEAIMAGVSAFTGGHRTDDATLLVLAVGA